MQHILQIISLVVGFIVICLAVFLKEDEENNLINRIEQLWLKLEVGQEKAISTHSFFLLKSSMLSKQILNNLFGNKTFSLRFFIVSLNLSLISFVAFLTLFVYIRSESRPHDPYIFYNPYRLQYQCFILIYFALIMYIMFFKNSHQWFFKFCCILLCIDLFLLIWAFGFYPNELIPQLISMPLSVGGDIILIYILKIQFEKISESNLFFQLFKISLISFISFLILVVLPDYFMYGKHYENSVIDFFTNLIWYQSFGDIYSLLPFMIFFLSILLFGLHRIIWPIIIRPVYALKRFGFFKYRKSLSVLGIILIVSSVNSDPLFVPKTLFNYFVGK
jgi:hypothetical protein